MKIATQLCLTAACLALGAIAARADGENYLDVGRIQYPYPQIGPDWPKTERPSWLSKGLVFVGDWEPYAWELRKNWQNWGNARAGEGAQELHRLDRSEATIADLKRHGVNMILNSFHKGFGIRNEADTMEEARQLAERLHRHGMRMGVLVSTLLMYEDLYGEFPESRTWHRVLFDGTPDTYGNDGFRYRAYLNHPAFIAYMKRVCELAVKSGVDALFFDTVRQLSENHHPMAERAFREWLKVRYPTDEAWYYRTGLHYRDFVKIPHIAAEAAALETLDQSIIQEYQVFKAEQITAFAAEMRAFIHQLNPEVAIWFNTGGITGQNVYEAFNMDHARLLPQLDIFYSEERDYADVNEHGGIVSKIRTIKAGQRFGAIHANATGQPPHPPERSLQRQGDDPRLRLAEAMAFNRLSLGNLGYGSTNVLKTFPEKGWRYVDFYWKNFDLFRDCESAAEVAVLRTFASLAYNNFTAHAETVLAEQALIQSQIPFDFLFDQDVTVAALSRYKVVVLGDQESLSDAQVRALGDYVSRGGSIVATRDTSMYNDWRRQREKFGLAAIFGLDAPPDGYAGAAHRNESGAGRSVYIPRMIPAVAIPPRTACTLKYWAPPRNRREFAEGVRWAARGKLAVEVETPDTVALEVCRQRSTGRTIIHLVNYRGLKDEPLRNVRLRLSDSAGGRCSHAMVYSPDAAAPVRLEVTDSTVTLPLLSVYAIVVPGSEVAP